MNTVIKGKKGEECAAAFLKAAGYTIIAMNFRYKGGEIDIIAEKDDVLIFTEVKTWDSFDAGNLEYAVNGSKMKKIIKTAKYFLSINRSYENRLLRLDLIFITSNCNKIKHIKNAFNEV